MPVKNVWRSIWRAFWLLTLPWVAIPLAACSDALAAGGSFNSPAASCNAPTQNCAARNLTVTGTLTVGVIDAGAIVSPTVQTPIVLASVVDAGTVRAKDRLYVPWASIDEIDAGTIRVKATGGKVITPRVDLDNGNATVISFRRVANDFIFDNSTGGAGLGNLLPGHAHEQDIGAPSDPVRAGHFDNLSSGGVDAGVGVFTSLWVNGSAVTGGGNTPTTVYDCDYRAQTPQGLDAGQVDGTAYPICGKSLYANALTAVVNGSNVPDISVRGIRIVPAASTSFASNSQNCPGFYVKLRDLISDVNAGTKYRATIAYSSTFTANNHEVHLSEWGLQTTGGTHQYFFGVRHGYGTIANPAGAHLYWFMGGYGGNAALTQAPNAGGAAELKTAQNQISITASLGVARGVLGSVDYSDGGAFPQVSATAPYGVTGPIIGWAQTPVGDMPSLSNGPGDANIIFCAANNGDGTVREFVVERMKIETLP